MSRSPKTEVKCMGGEIVKGAEYRLGQVNEVYEVSDS